MNIFFNIFCLKDVDIVYKMDHPALFKLLLVYYNITLLHVLVILRLADIPFIATFPCWALKI